MLLACDCNNVELVEYLVKEKGVDIQSTTVDGKTGLHVAALHDYSAIASLLISNSVSVTVQDEDVCVFRIILYFIGVLTQYIIILY